MTDTLESLLEQARTVSPAEIPAFLGGIEVARTTALARLSAPSPAPRQADELLGVDQAATRLGVGVDYLYRNHRKFSFTRREGRRLLFSANGIAEHIANPK